MVSYDQRPSLTPRLRELTRTSPPAHPENFIFAKQPLSNTLPSPEGNTLEQRRRAHMVDFLKDYPEVWTAWEKGGLLNPEAQAANIVEHLVIAGIIGRIIARKIGLSQRSCHEVALALLLHDADKIIEIQKLQTGATKGKFANQRRTVAPILIDGHLFLEGIVCADIISLASANIPTSRQISSDPRSQIVHYVDTILDGSVLKTPEQRMKVQTTSSGGRNTLVTRLRYKVHERELGLQPEQDGFGYPELQIRLAHREAEIFLAQIKGAESQTSASLPTYLQNLFDREVNLAA